MRRRGVLPGRRTHRGRSIGQTFVPLVVEMHAAAGAGRRAEAEDHKGLARLLPATAAPASLCKLLTAVRLLVRQSGEGVLQSRGFVLLPQLYLRRNSERSCVAVVGDEVAPLRGHEGRAGPALRYMQISAVQSVTVSDPCGSSLK